MPDVEDYNDEAFLIDLVKNAPLPREASAVDAGELLAERPAYALRIRQKRPREEFDGGDRHVMRQQFSERATSRRCRAEFAAIRHEARRPRTRPRTASVP